MPHNVQLSVINSTNTLMTAEKKQLLSLDLGYIPKQFP